MSDPRPIEPDDGSPEELHEEEAIGKAYDSRLLARLWPYMRPLIARPGRVDDLAMVGPLFLARAGTCLDHSSTGLDRVIRPVPRRRTPATRPTRAGSMRLLESPQVAWIGVGVACRASI